MKKEVKLSHLRVFGCTYYVHVDANQRNKLDAKSKKCTFIGYGTDDFGYRFCDHENQKIIKSINVVFNENGMNKEKAKKHKGKKEFVEIEDIF